MKSVLIVDDHPVIRAALKLVLEREGFKRIHEAASVGEALTILRQHPVDVLILDLVMPDGSGLDLLERIRSSAWKCVVLVFTSLDPLFFQERCMRGGALAYVSKTNSLDQLHKALHALMAGYTYFAQLVSSPMNPLQHSEKKMIDSLSNREMNILQHLARGLSNKAIAKAMNLSHKTVSTYKTRLIIKLRVVAAVHLRDFAIRNHLI
ncbi:response regulator [Pseudomonas sp. MDT2-39-1]